MRKQNTKNENISRRDFLGISGKASAASIVGLGLTKILEGKLIHSDKNYSLGQPNVLIILVDQLRYDVFSHRGCAVISTPNLDRLASEGVVLMDATCSSPLCGPSRASLLSGCYSFDGTFIHKNCEPDEPGIFKKEIKTIDETLAKAGYHVEYHGKWHVGKDHLECYKGDCRVYGHRMMDYNDYLTARYEKPKLDNGYAYDFYSGWNYRKWNVDDIMGSAKQKGYQMPHDRQAGVIEVNDEDTMTAWTSKKTIRFLNSNPQTPFCVTCSILQPHAPLIASENYANLVNPAEISMPQNLYGYYPPRLLEFGKPPVPEAVPDNEKGLGQFMALYYGLVKEVDNWTGRILDALEKNGYKDNTLVIFTADHGELMGSHRTFSKMQFFEECLRVPLIIRYPEGMKKRQQISGPVTGADIAPTILDYCGIAPIKQFHGKSLRKTIEEGTFSDPYAYSDLKNQKCLRSNDWKLIITKGEPDMLFDLRNDPLEMKNLLDDDYIPIRIDKIVRELRNKIYQKYM